MVLPLMITHLKIVQEPFLKYGHMVTETLKAWLKESWIIAYSRYRMALQGETKSTYHYLEKILDGQRSPMARITLVKLSKPPSARMSYHRYIFGILQSLLLGQPFMTVLFSPSGMAIYSLVP